MGPPVETAASLTCPHGFFGRQGGVSEAPYESLNVGLGSGDDLGDVEENRARCRRALKAEALVTARQTHSAVAAFVETASPGPIEADALVTRTPGLLIGVLSADCLPVLLQDRTAGLVGAAHAGWRGSLGGILEATVALMKKHGAAADRLEVAIGPALRAPHFEAEEDLRVAVLARFRRADRFFQKTARPGKLIYDHEGFARWRLEECGIDPEAIETVGADTLARPDLYFSYRHSRQRGAGGYGRNLSAIRLPHG